MDGEHVGLFHGTRVDALLRLDRRQCGETIAVEGCSFEFEFGGGLLHLAGELFLDVVAAAGQEIASLVHQFGIAGKIDLAGAGARAAADLIEQARPGAAFEKTVGAGADQKRALQRRDGAIDGAGVGERPEIAPRPRLRAAMLEDLRRPVVAGDQDIGKRLVVAQLHVEARPQLLDQVGLEQQRFGLGRGGDDLDGDGGRDHAQDPRRQRCIDAGIGRQPLADILGLADVQHVVSGIEHAIDAGRGRRQPHRVFDRGMADRKRALGDDLSGFLHSFRQPCVVIVLGDRRRGIDVGGDKSLRRQIRLRTPARLARGFRMVGRIVIHGPKLSAGRPHRQRQHDAEKRKPVFRKDHARTRTWRAGPARTATASKRRW